MIGLIVIVVVLGTAIWVAADTSDLGAKRGILGGGRASHTRSRRPGRTRRA